MRPIVTAACVLVARSPQSRQRASRTLNFGYRSFLHRDRAVAGAGFAPLPATTQPHIVALLLAFRMPDGTLVPMLSRGEGASDPAQT